MKIHKNMGGFSFPQFVIYIYILELRQLATHPVFMFFLPILWLYGNRKEGKVPFCALYFRGSQIFVRFALSLTVSEIGKTKLIRITSKFGEFSKWPPMGFFSKIGPIGSYDLKFEKKNIYICITPRSLHSCIPACYVIQCIS